MISKPCGKSREEIEGPTSSARLSRAVADDIQACGKALAKATQPRIHTGIGASDIHVMGKFRDERYGKHLERKAGHDSAAWPWTP